MKKLVIPLILILQTVAQQKKSFELTYKYTRNETCLDHPLLWLPDSRKFTSQNTLGPIVECYLLRDAFIECDEPVPLYGSGQTGPQPANDSYHNEGKCLRMGGYRAEDIEFTNVKCRVLDCIECNGPRSFTKLTPCIIYTGHYFLTTLLYSIFLGLVAVDRFCLGYSAMAVGKLMTLGGFGVWWIVDIFLLVLGYLGPADDSNWEPNY